VPTQEDRTRATRAALVSAARRLFADRGYDDVSSGEIAAAAGVTRGALYHHFADKRELFEAVFEQLEEDLTAAIARLMADDPRPVIQSGLQAFLDVCTQPEVVRIGLTEAPAVLGWQRWREIESRYGLGLVRAALSTTPAIEPAFLDAAAHIVVSALIEAALVIAHAPDPQAARGEAEAALTLLLDRVLPA
jgi:AcrR family transcriptional regulator